MPHHLFSPRAAAAAAGLAILLTAGTATAAVGSTPAPKTPVPPGAPTGLTAVPGNGTVTLSWSAPSSDGGAPVSGYFITAGTSPTDTSITDLVGGTTVTMSHLSNGTVYFFRVDAQNDTGDGPAATATATPRGSGAGAGSVPGAPTGLKASSGDGFIALSWSPPASPVTGYHVYLGFSQSLVGAREFATSSPSFRLTDAENGSLYYIKVTALNAAGEGAGTPETSVFVGPHAPVTPVTPSAAPAPPTGLTARAYRGEVALSWSPPPGGLQPGQGYLIYMGTSPGHEGAKPSVPHLIENTTRYTVAPLADGTRYYFQVAMLSADNQVSARSAEVSAVPGADSGAGSGPAPGVGSSAGPGGGKAGGGKAGPPTAAPLPSTDAFRQQNPAGLPAGLIVALAVLALAATAAAITIMVIRPWRRRRPDGRYAPVPAPRRPHDDQPASRPAGSRS